MFIKLSAKFIIESSVFLVGLQFECDYYICEHVNSSMYSFDIVKNFRSKKWVLNSVYDTIEHQLVFISRMIMHPINEYILHTKL